MHENMQIQIVVLKDQEYGNRRAMAFTARR